MTESAVQTRVIVFLALWGYVKIKGAGFPHWAIFDDLGITCMSMRYCDEIGIVYSFNAP